MQTLHDPARHEPLSATPWRAGAAREAIERIVDDALRSFTPERLWPMHPLDEPEPGDALQHGMYLGAGGMIWALHQVRRAGAIDHAFDFSTTVATLVERNRAAIADWNEPHGSFLFGDTGLLWLQWQSRPEAATADALFEAVEANLHHKSLEQLWGSPGSLLATIAMAEATGEGRWRDQLERGLRILWDAMQFDEGLGAWIWTQDLYGRRVRYLGAGHGFAGNVFPALRGAALLPRALVDGYVERALQTLSATAVHDGECVNWLPACDPPATSPVKWLLQDCHGAPGIVCRLASAPRTPAWDALLRAAGEAAWRAGPLEKGVGLCHGTAGNGYALLKLWQRTGDAVWLERARAFAMHAIEQVQRFAERTGQTRHSLWTGDIGVALYLRDCLDGQARYPTLDVF